MRSHHARIVSQLLTCFTQTYVIRVTEQVCCGLVASVKSCVKLCRLMKKSTHCCSVSYTFRTFPSLQCRRVWSAS